MKDHKLTYGIYLRVGMFSSLITVIMMFSFIPYAEPQPYELKRDIITMIENIDQVIEKYDEPPPVDRPKVAIEAPSDITENAVETIAATDLIEDIICINPKQPDIEIVHYYKVEVKPQPINIPKPVYPAIAIKAGIEGQTVIKALVDIDGSIMEAQILKSSGNQMLDQAALDAAMKAKFTPARQRDKAVRVWVSIPIKFVLTAS